MGPLEISGPARLMLGLVTGILFGFILQKAQVTKYQKIVAFFRWSDLTVQKVMFAAILVGMVGVYAMHEFGWVNLHIKPTLLGANILGELIFGRGNVAPGVLTRHLCCGLRRRPFRWFISRHSRDSDRRRCVFGSVSVDSG